MDNRLFGRVIDTIDDAVFILLPDGTITYRNHAFREMYGDGCAGPERVGLAFIDFDVSEPDVLRAMADALANAQPFAGDLIGCHSSGRRLWIRLSLIPEMSSSGDLEHHIGVCRDLSLYKNAELMASKLERDYRFIFENVQSAITVHGADAKIRIANSAAIELLGIDEASLVGLVPDDPLWALLREDGSDMPFPDYPVLKAINEGAPVRGTIVGYRRSSDAKLLWFVCNAMPVVDDSGAVQEVLLSFTDITRLIEVEAEANSFRERFELAARATQDVIFEWDIGTGQFWANDAFLTVYGYPAPPFIRLDSDRNISALTADYEKVRAVTLNAINSGQERYSVDYVISRPDGTRGHVAVRAFITRDPEGNAQRIIGTGTDIGQLTQAIKDLKQSEARFRLIADTASDVLWDYDFETNRTWSSPDWASKLGLEIGPETAQNFKWLETVEPSDQAKVLSSFEQAVRSTESVWEVEFRATRSDGQHLELALKSSILRNAEGRAVRMVGNMRNVTREKRNQEGYTRARALEAVGQLTGGIAHDFNNLMMIILGNAELLELGGHESEWAEAVAAISQAAQSAGTLTQRLLTFSRQAPMNTSPVNLAELLTGTMALLRAGLPATITISHDIASDIWIPNVDPNGLEQAIVNLAMNAKDALPRGGKIQLQCSNLAVNSQTSPAFADLAPGNYVVISVCDNGQGMAPDVLARAFEPFFTTKEPGKGTGLGLSTVYGFANQSNGRASIASEENIGTTVSIYLPASDSKGAVQQPVHAASKQVMSAEKARILVVEDQLQVRRHVAKTLRRLGYHVSEAEDAAGALDLLKQDQKFELLFTDIVMPGGMNGRELGDEIALIAPETRILYTSGYPAGAFGHVGLDELSDINLLRKPYKTVELEQAVIRALAGQLLAEPDEQ
jgi:PAS domain S-box-containing protein